jgi:DGQHR domain-containing protein
VSRPEARARMFSYQALSYAQRDSSSAPKFAVFHARAGDIIDWADVDRLGPTNLTGAQRPLRDMRVGKIARFLTKDGRNTIPTAVVIALDEGAVSFEGKARGGAGQHGTVTITMSGQRKPGLIIDGQHRVFGAAKFSMDFQLNVVAFLGGDDAERAFQFLVINNAAARVNKNHIKSLNLSFDKNKLNARLLSSAGLVLALDDQKYDDLQAIDGSDPFKGLLEWPTNANGFIPPNAIESAIAETRDRAALLGIEDLERDVFLAIWMQVHELRAAAWKRWPESRLLTKVSVWGLTVYILDSMVAKQRNEDLPIDFTSDGVLKDHVTRVVSRIPEQFWTADWKLKELDTASGRQTLLESLQVMDSNVRFSRPWYDRVPLIEPALLDGDTQQGSARRAVKGRPRASKGRSKS